MVDFKFVQVSLHREPPEVGLVEKLYPEICIGGWSCVYQPYIESTTALSGIYEHQH